MLYVMHMYISGCYGVLLSIPLTGYKQDANGDVGVVTKGMPYTRHATKMSAGK